MNTDRLHGAYSAHVDMWLIVDGERISVTQMGPDFLHIKPVREHPPGSAATVGLQIDDSKREWQVRLPDGIRPGQTRVQLSK
jgi:hypothetical protein